MLNKIRKLRAKKGFTLVELIVVIAIIAILTAVLVPLIGNYAQQASYTMLMDSAQTISNTGNNALANYAASGKVCGTTAITGKASSAGGLAVTVTGGTTDEQTAIKKEVEETLKTTLPSKCAFYISVKNGAVEGVVYTNDSSTIAAGKTKSAGITGKEFFQNSTDGTADGPAIGVTGKYKAAGIAITAVS